MIHSEEGKVRLEGSASTLLAEITIVLSRVVEVMSEELDISEEVVIDTILEGRQLNKLLKSGMNPSEALEVMGGKYDNETT